MEGYPQRHIDPPEPPKKPKHPGGRPPGKALRPRRHSITDKACILFDAVDEHGNFLFHSIADIATRLNVARQAVLVALARWRPYWRDRFKPSALSAGTGVSAVILRAYDSGKFRTVAELADKLTLQARDITRVLNIHRPDWRHNGPLQYDGAQALAALGTPGGKPRKSKAPK